MSDNEATYDAEAANDENQDAEPEQAYDNDNQEPEQEPEAEPAQVQEEQVAEETVVVEEQAQENYAQAEEEQKASSNSNNNNSDNTDTNNNSNNADASTDYAGNGNDNNSALPETVAEAFTELSSDNPAFNWFSAKPKSAKLKNADIVIDRTGAGGLSELADYLKTNSDQIIFALLRVNTFDNFNSVRLKFLWVKFVGTKVPFMSKAKLTPQLGSIAEHFTVIHLSKELDESLAGFDPAKLSKEFLRIGGAHKPNRYEYGPDQTYSVTK